MECHKGFWSTAQIAYLLVQGPVVALPRKSCQSRKKTVRMMQRLLNAFEMHAGEYLQSLQDKWGP